MRPNIRPRSTLLALILTIVVCSGLADAQQTNSTAANSQTTDAQLREKAFNLLESLAEEISSLQSAENRARLGSNIAGSLWTHNEKRARTLLIAVEQDIKTGLQNREISDQEDLQTLQVFLQLRMDTVERIAKHDAEAALAFLKATELSSDKPLPWGIAAERERAVELRLAQRIALNNPDLALKIGHHSLARGLSNELLSLLMALSRKHREQALTFYKDIILKLKVADLARDWQARYFAQNLARSFTPPMADESTYKELMNLFSTAAVVNGCGKKMSEHDEMVGFCAEIAVLVRYMKESDPARADDELEREGYDELNELTQSSTPEEILALAEKYPHLEGEIHWRAIMRAEEAGDGELARKIATEYRGDPERRRQMLDQTEDQIWTINDEKLAEILRGLSKITRIEERLGILVALASRIGTNDRKTALKLLNQASGLVETMKPGKEQTAAQIGLATRYCLEKSDRGLGIMESLVPKFNDLITAAMKLDTYDNRYVRDGEWNMTGEGGLGNLLTQLAQTAGYFAWCDFDRAVSLAAQFERPEIRLMAQLKLAQGILAGPPKRYLMVSVPVP